MKTLLKMSLISYVVLSSDYPIFDRSNSCVQQLRSINQPPKNKSTNRRHGEVERKRSNLEWKVSLPHFWHFGWKDGWQRHAISSLQTEKASTVNHHALRQLRPQTP
uniref:Uncharacterized protein n=1 Tax=Nelumbo nucifera TaxID=4432 RepID=A0A822XJ56_NELNU|nr:TPA_asm: hypothetical protein HUJ06_020644 [Nelumbo nucifera]